jgi:ribosomal protein L19
MPPRSRSFQRKCRAGERFQWTGSQRLAQAEKIAWPKPTRPGDTLHVEDEIVEITPSRSKPDQGIVTVRSAMINQEGEAVYF